MSSASTLEHQHSPGSRYGPYVAGATSALSRSLLLMSDYTTNMIAATAVAATTDDCRLTPSAFRVIQSDGPTLSQDK